MLDGGESSSALCDRAKPKRTVVRTNPKRKSKGKETDLGKGESIESWKQEEDTKAEEK